MKTLDELMLEYEPERLADIVRSESPDIVALRLSKSRAEREREIRQGLRDSDGNWIDVDESEDGDTDEEDETYLRDGD